MTGSKKTWVKPELIVLVRSRPEEAVLLACKGNALRTSNTAGRGWCGGWDGKVCVNPCSEFTSS
jgi:hypothetical protein